MNLLPEWPGCLLQKRIGSFWSPFPWSRDTAENSQTCPIPAPRVGALVTLVPHCSATGSLWPPPPTAAFHLYRRDRELQPNLMVTAPCPAPSPLLLEPRPDSEGFYKAWFTEKPTACLLSPMEEAGFRAVPKVQSSKWRQREMVGPAQGPVGVSDRMNSLIFHPTPNIPSHDSAGRNFKSR